MVRQIRGPYALPITSELGELLIRSSDFNRVIEPILICPAYVVTAMSAIVESSVSPDLAETIVRKPASFAVFMTPNASVSVPIVGRASPVPTLIPCPHEPISP